MISSLIIPLEALQKISGFCLLLDENLCIQWLSKSLRKLCPELELGLNLLAEFSCESSIQKSLKTKTSNDLVFIRHLKSSLELRGISLVLKPDLTTLLVLSPKSNHIGELIQRGFTVADFSVHDTLFDCLMLIQAHQTTTKESHYYAKALRQQLELEFYKRAVDESSMFVLTDAKGVITHVNNTFCQLSGFSKEELLGKTHRVISSGKHESEFYRSLWDILLTRKVFRGEICNRKKDGSLFWVDTTIVPFTDETGKIESYAAIQRDVSEKRFAMEQLELASKAKADFLANMSHEIRTPMNGIIGMMSLLSGSESLEEAKEYGRTIKSSSELLLRLVNDILDLSKIEAGKISIEPSWFDIRTVVGTLIDLHKESAEKKGIFLRKNVAVDVPSLVEGDALRIQQILSNLLSNAIKFTEKGGVQLGIQFQAIGSKECRVTATVMDTGMGMSSEVVEKLFQRFEQGDSSTTKKFGGTGLGLAISKKMAEILGGQLTVQSVEGRGTTFRCELPMKYQFKPSENLGSPQNTRIGAGAPEEIPIGIVCTPSGGKPKVLIAEDNPVNQFVLTKILSRLGCESHSVANGLEAITAAQSFRYDLILMDCFMPELDGYDAALKIKEEPGPCQNVPIVAVTANALAGEAEKCASFGMAGYLAKPIELRTLSLELRKYWPLKSDWEKKVSVSQ